jgi:hypothetical protein
MYKCLLYSEYKHWSQGDSVLTGFTRTLLSVPKPQNYLSEGISVYVKPLKLILKKINLTTVVFICKI